MATGCQNAQVPSMFRTSQSVNEGTGWSRQGPAPAGKTSAKEGLIKSRVP